jgi:hypothetical protein
MAIINSYDKLPEGTDNDQYGLGQPFHSTMSFSGSVQAVSRDLIIGQMVSLRFPSILCLPRISTCFAMYFLGIHYMTMTTTNYKNKSTRKRM